MAARAESPEKHHRKEKERSRIAGVEGHPCVPSRHGEVAVLGDVTHRKVALPRRRKPAPAPRGPARPATCTARRGRWSGGPVCAATPRRGKLPPRSPPRGRRGQGRSVRRRQSTRLIGLLQIVRRPALRRRGPPQPGGNTLSVPRPIAPVPRRGLGPRWEASDASAAGPGRAPPRRRPPRPTAGSTPSRLKPRRGGSIRTLRP